MRPKWLRVRKSYQGGTSSFDYIMLHPDDTAEEAARSWANRSPGGSNYGWTVHWTPVEMPPVEWIDSKIASLEKKIKIIDKNIVTYTKEKELLLKKIKANEVKINLASIERDLTIDKLMEGTTK